MVLNDADDLPREECYTASIAGRRWLSDITLELNLLRPPPFEFLPGQYSRVLRGGDERPYTMACAPGGATLDFCIRHTGGEFTSYLSRARIGSSLEISGPEGYFTYRPSKRKPVLVATGTGVAPFVSFARTGASGYILLHGARGRSELYYEEVLRPHARLYVPCISGSDIPDSTGENENWYSGSVTEYLRRRLPGGGYDFYLCGRSDMIRDAVLLIDELFPDSFVYMEPFYWTEVMPS